MKAAWIAAAAGAVGCAVAVAPALAGPRDASHGAAAGWAGAYGGVHLGWGDVSVGGEEGDNAIGGLHLGYNWALGDAVIGTELDYDVADIFFGPAEENLDSHKRVKLRAGFASGRSLTYVAGGLSWSNGDIAGADRTDTGWFGGIGYSYQIHDRWVAGAEVLEHRFDDFDGTGLDMSATTATARLSYRF